MTAEIEQIKQKEILYLIAFLLACRTRPTIGRAQDALRQAIGVWSITTDDIETYWPAMLRHGGQK